MNIKEICFYSIEKSSQAQRIKIGRNLFAFNILNPKKFVNLSFNFAAQKKAYKVHEMVVNFRVSPHRFDWNVSTHFSCDGFGILT